MGRPVNAKIVESRPGVYYHWCPACKQRHMIYVGEPSSTGKQWQINGDFDNLSMTPSMLIYSDVPDTSEFPLTELAARKIEGKIDKIPYHRITICHYIISEGKITYCGDCQHDYKGLTIEIPDIPQHGLPYWCQQQAVV